ncbi:MAG TPA: hypothetical protein PKV02_04785 [Bacteroidia bacterium]|mgnify:FL=1|nr:hypothetical protein [Bacteroidia bacterium]
MKALSNGFAALLLSILMYTNCVYAQNATAVLQLDTNRIVAGQQITAKLRFTAPADYQSKWVAIPDTFNGIDVISRSPIDTLPSANKSLITREQKFTLTAFDSGFFVITPFVFNYTKPGDTTNYTVETQAQLLTSNLMPVDTTKAIHDIKGPMNVGITWQEIVMYASVILLLIAIIWYVVYRLRKKKPQIVIKAPEAPKRPAHEIAIEQLEHLQQEKLWQQGDFKMYYTHLSDIMRAYISNRWNFDAMESTTDEIMHSNTALQLSADNFNRLKNTLTLSDLAKFAKYTPLSNENEQAMTDAFIFVNETKVVPTVKPQEQVKS